MSYDDSDYDSHHDCNY